MIMKLIRKAKMIFASSKVIRNAGWLVAEQVFQMLVSLVVGVLTARYLGPTNYGSLNYTASFVTFASAISTLGMEGVCIKKLIAYPDEEGRYLGGCLLLRFLSGLLSSITITFIVSWLNPDDKLKTILVALQSIQLVFQSLYIFDAWFQRHLKSKYVSIGKMVACVIVSVYKIYLLANAKSLIWFAFSNSLNYIVVSIILVIFYYVSPHQKVKLNITKGNEVLHESYHFIISGIMTAIYGQMDKIMIGQMLTDTDVGFYTTASALCGMWIFVPTAIINSFRPVILEYKQKGDQRKYIDKLLQLYSCIIWLCLLVSICVFLLGPIIINVLYGREYAGAADPLRIIIWCETFSMIGTARGIWIISENMNKYVKYYLGIGAIVNLVLNYILIPILGTNGAALATLITQITTSLIAPVLFRDTRIHTRYVLDAFILRWYFDKKEKSNG